MVGLIWMVQVVHYPLFRAIGRDHFVAYEAGHTRRIGSLLAVPASVEIVTAALVAMTRPEDVSLSLALVSGALLVLIWVMTGFIQARQHGALSEGFDPDLHRRLVSGNWWRTGGWTARGILAGMMLS
jgi:hypothetical protein